MPGRGRVQSGESLHLPWEELPTKDQGFPLSQAVSGSKNSPSLREAKTRGIWVRRKSGRLLLPEALAEEEGNLPA
jgi:hypothetical protein